MNGISPQSLSAPAAIWTLPVGLPLFAQTPPVAYEEVVIAKNFMVPVRDDGRPEMGRRFRENSRSCSAALPTAPIQPFCRNAIAT